jgi:hypothetical protein
MILNGWLLHFCVPVAARQLPYSFNGRAYVLQSLRGYLLECDFLYKAVQRYPL